MRAAKAYEPASLVGRLEIVQQILIAVHRQAAGNFGAGEARAMPGYAWACKRCRLGRR